MDVLSLLKEDHRTVGTLLDEAADCEPGDGRLDALAAEIESALTVHAGIEEQYFYPALKERAEEREQVVDVFEAYTEHELVKTLIDLLRSGRQPDEQFKAEVQVLGENVKHHVKEEESTIFSLARELLDPDELEELGEAMQEAKERMLAPRARQNSARKTAARKGAAKKGSTAKKRSTGKKTPKGRKTTRTRR